MAFIKANLDTCPSCGENDISIEIDSVPGARLVEVDCVCQDCGCRWTDTYEYKHTTVAEQE